MKITRDIGCGNGRATRMYVDCGFRPDQITGTDLRGNAVASAGKLNPASTLEHRKFVIEQADAVLKPGGYIFYYDLVNANPFAGGDRIHPDRLFGGFDIIWHPEVRDFQFIPLSQRAHLALA
jgi:SAM-dependent methyltransferase